MGTKIAIENGELAANNPLVLERRQTSRFVGNRLYAAVGNSRSVKTSSVVNFSLGGALLKQRILPGVGQRARIEFFDDENSIHLDASVIRSGKKTALRFSNLTSKAEDFFSHRIYTEVLRRHDPTVLIVDTDIMRGRELQQQISNALPVRVLRADTLLGFVDRLALSRPPITYVIATDCEGHVSGARIVDFVREEYRAIVAVNREPTIDATIERLGAQIPNAGARIKFSSERY